MKTHIHLFEAHQKLVSEMFTKMNEEFEELWKHPNVVNLKNVPIEPTEEQRMEELKERVKKKNWRAVQDEIGNIEVQFNNNGNWQRNTTIPLTKVPFTEEGIFRENTDQIERLAKKVIDNQIEFFKKKLSKSTEETKVLFKY